MADEVIPARREDLPAEEPQVQPDKESTESDEIREGLSKTEGFWKSYLSNEKPEHEPEKEPEKTEVEPEKIERPEGEDTGKDPEKPEKPEKPAKSRKPKKQEADPIEIVRQTGREIATGLAEAWQKNQPKPPDAPAVNPFDQLPEDYRDDREVYETMVELWPDRYKDLGKQLSEYARKEDEYIKSWEAENPGEDFNAEDEQHNDFYRRIAPKLDKRHFEKAKWEVVERHAERRAVEKLSPKFKEWEARHKEEEIAPLLSEDLLSAAKNIVEEIDPENIDATKDWKSVKSLEESNPLAADVLNQVGRWAQGLLHANLRLMRGVEDYDAQNPAHRWIAQRTDIAEQEIKALPRENQFDDDGRVFATQEEYVRMTPDQKAKHWFLNERMMAHIISSDARKTAKKHYDEYSERFKKWSGKNGAKPAPAKPAPTVVPAKKDEGDDGSPSVTGRATLPATRGTSENKSKTGADLFFDRILGK